MSLACSHEVRAVACRRVLRVCARACAWGGGGVGRGWSRAGRAQLIVGTEVTKPCFHTLLTKSRRWLSPHQRQRVGRDLW